MLLVDTKKVLFFFLFKWKIYTLSCGRQSLKKKEVKLDFFPFKPNFVTEKRQNGHARHKKPLKKKTKRIGYLSTLLKSAQKSARVVVAK